MNYILYGSGGHAKVVIECLLSEGKIIDGFFDDAPKSAFFEGFPVLGQYDHQISTSSLIIISIGNNKIRKTVSEKISHQFGNVNHQRNIISPSVEFSMGNMFLPGVIINAGSKIGNHVIINTAAIIEHDCKVGNFVHMGPGSVICGNVEVGEGTLIGSNAVVAPNIKIGKWCQISAGSSVMENVPDFSLVIGVPGKIIKTII